MRINPHREALIQYLRGLSTLNPFKEKPLKWKVISPIYCCLVERMELQGYWLKKDKNPDPCENKFTLEDLLQPAWHIAGGNFTGTNYIGNAEPNPSFDIKQLNDNPNSTILINTNNIDLTSVSNLKAPTPYSNNQDQLTCTPILVSPAETRCKGGKSNLSGEDIIFHDPKGIYFTANPGNRCTKWFTECEPSVEESNVPWYLAHIRGQNWRDN